MSARTGERVAKTYLWPASERSSLCAAAAAAAWSSRAEWNAASCSSGCAPPCMPPSARVPFSAAHARCGASVRARRASSSVTALAIAFSIAFSCASSHFPLSWCSPLPTVPSHAAAASSVK